MLKQLNNLTDRVRQVVAYELGVEPDTVAVSMQLDSVVHYPPAGTEEVFDPIVEAQALTFEVVLEQPAVIEL